MSTSTHAHACLFTFLSALGSVQGGKVGMRSPFEVIHFMCV